jgi:hypothetical protein
MPPARRKPVSDKYSAIIGRCPADILIKLPTENFTNRQILMFHKWRPTDSFVIRNLEKL